MKIDLARGDALLTALETQTVRRVFVRLSWFLFVLSIVMSMDRTNIGFASLQMNKALGLTAVEFGLTFTIYSIGYIVAEIPSNVMMARIGAKVWLPRIAITWGIASTATMFAVGPKSLYLTRIILGVAEGGFLPGVLLYLSLWLPEYHRARAMSLFLLAQAVSFAVNPLISGPLLQIDGTLGLQGWQWLFLLEGLPSILLGIFGYYYLTDLPKNARWLSAEEKTALYDAMHRQEPAAPDGGAQPRREYRSWVMFCLALTYFGMPVSLATYAAWSPAIVRELAPAHSSFITIGLINAIAPAVAIVVMPWWSARSDRAQERLWHTIVPLVLTAVGWIILAESSNSFAKMIGLTMAITFIFCAQGIFFTLASGRLSRAARPVGIAMISATGLCGAAFSPPMVGYLREVTGSFAAGLLFAAAMLAISVAALLLMKATVPASEAEARLA